MIVCHWSVTSVYSTAFRAGEVVQKILFDLDIYPYQIDFMGHVNNAVYIQWMEVGRVKLLEAVAMPTHEIAQRGFAPVLVQTQITYKLPLYLGDRPQVELWLSELRGASAVMQFRFRFHNDQQVLVAEGQQTGLFVNTQTMRPKRLTAEEKALFTAYLEPISD